ncbi:MAG TPA: IS1380 family transposase [Streptosporangiaceae bacterium]|nr:IS1380 family transposase [Streptosporangiaceae bacterium]
MHDMPWDCGLTVTGGGEGLVGHAGGVILREMADRAGLPAALKDALEREGRLPEVDRGVAMVSAAVMIALGGRSMSGIAVLEHLSLVMGEPVTWQTLRRTLDLADTATLEKIAQSRARTRAHVWDLITARASGFPWLAIAGRVLKGLVVIDMDATLITAHSPKEGAAGTYKSGFGFHPLGGWCANTGESLNMKLRPGNAGSNTGSDHVSGLSAAIAQVPAPYRRRILVRLDGAGASHEFIEHMMTFEVPGGKLFFTSGWTITETDEADIRDIPAEAWKPGVTQDGHAEDDTDVAEITGLMSRSGNWPPGLRWIIRRVKPSRRHLKKLTAYEKEAGWKYSIICTNIPEEGLEGVPGSRHAQFIDVLHRQHAVVEDGVRTGKAAGLRNLPSKSWRVNCGWTVAANIAADLQAWCRLLGLHDQDGLADAEPDTLRHRLWSIPARLVRHARRRTLKISSEWRWKDAFITCWQRISALPAPA